MRNDGTLILLDHRGRAIRLTQERQNHILEHPKMAGQLAWIRDTLLNPEVIVTTRADESVHVYHRHYAKTPVTSKYGMVQGWTDLVDKL